MENSFWTSCRIIPVEHGRRLAFFHPVVGAPIAAGLLEAAIAFGCKKFVVVGGAGVLEKRLAIGKLILVESAVRDEGLSYNHIEPRREIQAQSEALAAIRAALEACGLPCWLLVHPPWFIGKNYIISKLMKKKKCWCGFPGRFGFIPKQYEFWYRGFVKRCPIMELAVRNYF